LSEGRFKRDGDQERKIKLLLWDVAGEEEMDQVPDSYIKGASAYLFVADCTCPSTLSIPKMTKERVLKKFVDDLPYVILLNGSDLVDEWQKSEDEWLAWEAEGAHCLLTSANSGVGVE